MERSKDWMTKKVLEVARDLVAKGWVQGTFREFKADGSVCYCAIGAMDEAKTLTELHPWGITAKFAAVIGVDLVAQWNDALVAQWNDAPVRTQAEVVAAFDKAIETYS